MIMLILIILVAIIIYNNINNINHDTDNFIVNYIHICILAKSEQDASKAVITKPSKEHWHLVHSRLYHNLMRQHKATMDIDEAKKATKMRLAQLKDKYYDGEDVEANEKGEDQD